MTPNLARRANIMGLLLFVNICQIRAKILISVLFKLGQRLVGQTTEMERVSDMKDLFEIKRLLRVALGCAALGAALTGGVAMAASGSAAGSDLFLKGDAQCTKCHDEADAPGLLAMAKTRHGVNADGRTPTCTSCHGDSVSHKTYAGKDKPPAPGVTFSKKSANTADERNQACLTCHKKDSTRHLWDGSAHQVNGVTCASCHELHTGHDKVRDKRTQTEVCYTCHKEQRADGKKMSHHPVAEGKLACSSCHSTHGSAGPKMLKKNTINETCFTCHAEKRGPFLWEHQPASEDCTNCHTSHGSNLSPLLKARPNFLCQECHDGAHQSGSPVGPVAGSYQGGLTVRNAANTTNAQPSVGQAGRACLNCHSMVHGTNSPTGAWLHR